MQLDAFMKIEEPQLAGESTDNLLTGQIEILSFEQAIVRRSQLGTAASESQAKTKATAEHLPIRIIKPLDKTSPKLMEAISKGTVYKRVTLSLCQPSGTTDTSSSSWKRIVYLEVKLEGVHLASFRFLGDPDLHYTALPGVFGPVEELELAYKKITWMYKGGSGSANISGSWNLGTNAPT